MSVFEAVCPQCNELLRHDQTWLWVCQKCAATFELCGIYLIECSEPADVYGAVRRVDTALGAPLGAMLE